MTNAEQALPKGWIWSTVRDVTLPIRKVDPVSDGLEHFDYIDIASIDNDNQRIVEPKRYSGKDAPSRARQEVRAHDVVFSTVRTYLKNIALVPEHLDGQIASTGFSVLRASGATLPKYLYYFSLTPTFLNALAELQRGTSYPAVRDSDVRAQPIPLAPLDEQRRIVAKIEELFSRVDAGVAALKRVQAALKRYKASVLKAACDGQLVPQDPSDEPADVLLKRILAERRAKWEADLRAKGKDPHKSAHPKTSEPDKATLHKLPHAWVWTSLGSVFDVSIGGTPSRSRPEYWGGRHAWVSSGEVAFTRIRTTRESITDLGLTNSNAKLHPPGTVLLAMIGEGKTRGQVSILDVEACNNQNVAAIRCAATRILPEYLYYWLQSRYEQTRKSGSGGMQYALNSERIRGFAFAVPPVDEQHRIVAEIDRRLSVVDQVEANITLGLAKASRLRQSILAKAFLGRLAY